jgi:hypothetical protein
MTDPAARFFTMMFSPLITAGNQAVSHRDIDGVTGQPLPTVGTLFPDSEPPSAEIGMKMHPPAGGAGPGEGA